MKVPEVQYQKKLKKFKIIDGVISKNGLMPKLFNY